MSRFILCFVFDDNGGYRPLPYSALVSEGVRNPEYADRYFLPLHGYLLEVSKEDYLDYYRSERRYRYINERATSKGDLYYHALDSEDLQGESIIADLCADVEAQAIRNVMAEKLHLALGLLSDEDQQLIRMIYFEEQTESQCAEVFGIAQQNINKRKKRILERLKKIFEV